MIESKPWPKLPVLETQEVGVKNCNTCAHQDYDNRCILTGYSINVQRQVPGPPCDMNLSGWTPIPPKKPWRSLAQWLYDTFFKLEL